MMLQLTFVDLFRARSDRALLDPPVGVLAEGDLAGVGVDPVATDHVGLDGREPLTGVVFVVKVCSAEICLPRCQ